MFQGFSNETIDFMWGIRFNNEKGWFEAHKAEYLQYFYEPLKSLSREVYAAMCEAYPDLGLISKVSRIYRDARRLHGGAPTRTVCGCLLNSLWRNGPAIRSFGSNLRPRVTPSVWDTTPPAR